MDAEATPIEIAVPQSHYVQFVFDFFQDRDHPVFLLWNIEKSEWYPEDDWDALLEQWTEGANEKKERVKEHARQLQNVKVTGRYRYFS
jgi:hypothetical protein